MKILKTVPFALALCLGACTSSADDSDAPEASPMDAALPEVDMAPQCGPGFVPVGEDDCEDIDECAQERCPLGVECENLEGSYNCPCEGNFEVGDRKSVV